MKHEQNNNADIRVKKALWKSREYLITYVVMLLISGIHIGLVVLLDSIKAQGIVSILAVLLYWACMAALFTKITHRQIKRKYDEPMQTLGKASREVAGGDFSIYLKPRHTAEKMDYIDVMYLDFNKMVEELGSIETMKTDFFSNVSHEMKTPLSVILNSLELVKSGKLTEEESRLQLDTAMAAAKRMADMITNLLKLNKLEKQTILPKPEPYDLCAQLCECALSFESVWEKKDIDFAAEIEDSVVIVADAGLMELVWNNLFSNAVKFTDTGGSILLRQKTEDGRIIVSVEDNGCGMSEETRRHIFDKFYQGDTSHATEGNGLGLALVQRILQLMDCTISVESKVHKGSVFLVTIPAKTEQKI